MMFGKHGSAYALFFTLVAAMIAMASAVGAWSFEFYISVRTLPTTLLIVSAPFLAWIGLITVRVLRRGVDRPLPVVTRLVRRYRHWMMRTALVLSTIIPGTRAASSIKQAIPQNVPFYADPYLADVERFILGVDAWRLTHAFLGPFGTLIIDRLYLLWFPALSVLMSWFIVSRDRVFQLRGLLTMLLSWALLGNLLATTMASVGPVFYEEFYGDDRFAPLLANLRAYDVTYPVKMLLVSEFLLQTYNKGVFGSGISAMPSMHVSIAMIWLLVTRDRFGWRSPTFAAVAFFAVTCVGSVHLGWHYVSDGLVSIIGTGLIWWAVGRLVAVLAQYDANRHWLSVRARQRVAPRQDDQVLAEREVELPTQRKRFDLLFLWNRGQRQGESP